MVIELFHSCLGDSIFKTFFCKFIYNMAGTTAVHCASKIEWFCFKTVVRFVTHNAFGTKMSQKH